MSDRYSELEREVARLKESLADVKRMVGPCVNNHRAEVDRYNRAKRDEAEIDRRKPYGSRFSNFPNN